MKKCAMRVALMALGDGILYAGKSSMMIVIR